MNIINEYKRQFPLGIENDDISDFEEYHCTKSTPFYHHNIYNQSLNFYHHQSEVSSNPSLSQTNDESINFLNSSRSSTTNLVKNYPPTYYTYSQRVDEAEGSNIETKSSNTKDKLLAKLNIIKRSSNLPVKNKDNKDNKVKPRTISAVGWDFNKDEEIRELTKRKNQLFGNESYKSSESEKSRSLSFMHNRKQRPVILDRSSLSGSQLGFPKRSMDSDKKSTSSLSGSSSTNYFFENIDDTGYLNKETFKSIGTPDFSGWLKKKGDKYKIWKTRYCVLRGVNFYYFKNDKEIESSHVKGYINLTGYRIIPDENLLHGKYGFKLIHDTEKSHNFAHDDVEQIKGWMKAMMKATIVRDSKAIVISSSNISTVSLSEAHKLTPHLPDPRRTSVNSVSLNKVISPTLRPTSPMLQPTSSMFQPTSPMLQPTSPMLQPTSPMFQQTSPMLQPTSPTLRPVSPILRPISPLSQRTVSPIPTRSLSPALQTLLNSTSP